MITLIKVLVAIIVIRRLIKVAKKIAIIKLVNAILNDDKIGRIKL